MYLSIYVSTTKGMLMQLACTHICDALEHVALRQLFRLFGDSFCRTTDAGTQVFRQLLAFLTNLRLLHLVNRLKGATETISYRVSQKVTNIIYYTQDTTKTPLKPSNGTVSGKQKKQPTNHRLTTTILVNLL